jgi:anti-anti-sigma factor
MLDGFALTRLKETAASARPVAFGCRRREGWKGKTVVEVLGELDLISAPSLDAMLLEDAGPEVVLDLRGLEFLDLIGARALARLCGEVRRSGRDLMILPSKPAVQAVLELTAGDAGLPVAPAREVTSSPGAPRSPLDPDVGAYTASAVSAAMQLTTTMRRGEAARQRDVDALLRDLVADARDRAADLEDGRAGAQEPTAARLVRARAREDRVRAAVARAEAAEDRERAASDRHHAETALAEAHLDELTGTYRRGLGAHVLGREIARARRSGASLVLAFIDLDGSQVVNDRDGRTAGDALIAGVAEAIRANLRPYDPVVRVGADEFVCALLDGDMDEVRRRFAQVGVALRRRNPGGSISVGLARLEPGDTLADLYARGDRALAVAKRRRQARRRRLGDDSHPGASDAAGE